MSSSPVEKEKFQRKPSLFPTAVDLPERGVGLKVIFFLICLLIICLKFIISDKYGRKQSVMDLTKEVYNLPKSQLIKNSAVPMSTRRLSMAVNSVLHRKIFEYNDKKIKKNKLILFSKND